MTVLDKLAIEYAVAREMHAGACAAEPFDFVNAEKARHRVSKLGDQIAAEGKRLAQAQPVVTTAAAEPTVNPCNCNVCGDPEPHAHIRRMPA